MAADPETGERVPLYRPRRDRWSDHFTWSDDSLTLVPLTAIERATVDRLQLNRPGAINVRRALIALGEEHPPPDAATPEKPPVTRRFFISSLAGASPVVQS